MMSKIKLLTPPYVVIFQKVIGQMNEKFQVIVTFLFYLNLSGYVFAALEYFPTFESHRTK